MTLSIKKNILYHFTRNAFTHILFWLSHFADSFSYDCWKAFVLRRFFYRRLSFILSNHSLHFPFQLYNDKVVRTCPIIIFMHNALELYQKRYSVSFSIFFRIWQDTIRASECYEIKFETQPIKIVWEFWFVWY